MKDENEKIEETLKDDILCLTLVRAEKPVQIEGEDGIIRKYTLREMMGSERDKYLNNVGGRVGGSEGNQTIKRFDNIQACLICKCLFDENNKLVPESVIASWPASTQVKLFEVCQKMNRLDKDSKEEAKKA